MQEAAGDHLGNGRICSACFGRYLEPETEREHQLLIAILHAEARRITRQRRHHPTQHHTPQEGHGTP